MRHLPLILLTALTIVGLSNDEAVVGQETSKDKPREQFDEQSEQSTEIPWNDFSSAKLKELRDTHKPVLVFCRADWDLTCEVLDRTLFSDRRVIDAIKEGRYIPLRADCSRAPDEMLKGFLKRVGWAGNATIVVFSDPQNEAPVVLQVTNASTLISTEDLLDAIKHAGPPQRTGRDETKPGPRETFVKYFQAMEARETEDAKAFKAAECTDTLHMNIHNLNIVNRLQPFYELSTAKEALVVAHPFTISREVADREEVIYAQLAKQNGAWRIQKLARTSPESASTLMKGFQMHSDVKLDLSTEALVGKWWYPCDSTIVLNGDGTGSDLEVGPGGHNPDEKPTLFKWTLDGSTLVLRFANRKEQLVVTSIDHIGVSFGTGYVGRREGWHRRTPVTLIADPIVENSFRSAIKKPTGELTQKDLEKEVWRLDFRFAPISDEGLREVSKIRQVKEILFSRVSLITDAGLREVAKLKHLEGLSLMETPITDAGLQELAKLRNIDSLNLQDTKITSAGLTQLLKSWNQPDEGVGEGASTLRYLLLDNCPGIDDSVLAEVSKLRHLKRLQLGNTKVSDAGLRDLAKLKNLESLLLGKTKVTREGIAQLRLALQKCEIRSDFTE